MIEQTEISGVILAGGKGRRVNDADKGLMEYKGRALFEHVAERIEPQVSKLYISANRNQLTYAQREFTVVQDTVQSKGPLAGIYATMLQIETQWLAVVPCDTPVLPLDTVSRLAEAVVTKDKKIAYCHDGEQSQHLIMLLSKELQDELRKPLLGKNYKVSDWLANMDAAEVSFSDQSYAFTNLNQLDDFK